jgi:hypothetical protein
VKGWRCIFPKPPRGLDQSGRALVLALNGTRIKKIMESISTKSVTGPDTTTGGTTGTNITIARSKITKAQEFTSKQRQRGAAT